jgi:hypothetical protein
VSGGRGTRAGGVLTEHGAQCPAAVGGKIADRVAALGEQVPQLLRGAHATGVSAGGRDHCDRFLLGRLQRVDAAMGLAQVRRHPAEVVDELGFVRHRWSFSAVCAPPRDPVDGGRNRCSRRLNPHRPV